MKKILEILIKFKKNAIYDSIDFTKLLLSKTAPYSDSILITSIDNFLSGLRAASTENLEQIKNLIIEKNLETEQDKLFWKYIREVYCEKNNENLRGLAKLLIDYNIPEGKYILYDAYVSKISHYTDENISQSELFLSKAIESKSVSAYSTVLKSNLKKSKDGKVEDNYNISANLSESGNSNGLTYLGYYHIQKKDYQNTLLAIRYLTLAANNNDIDACFLLADLYKNHPYLKSDQKVAKYTIKGFKITIENQKTNSPSYYFNDTCNILNQSKLINYTNLCSDNISFLEEKNSPYSDFIRANILKINGDIYKAKKKFQNLYRTFKLPEAAHCLGLIIEKEDNRLSPEALRFYNEAHSLSYPDACFKITTSADYLHKDLDEIDFSILSNNANHSDFGSQLYLERLFENDPSLVNLRTLKQNIDHSINSEYKYALRFKEYLMKIYTKAREETLDSIKNYSRKEAEDDSTRKERKEQFDFDDDTSDTEKEKQVIEDIDDDISNKYHSGIYFYDRKVLLKLILDNPLEFAALFNQFEINKILLEPELLILLEDLVEKIEENPALYENSQYNLTDYFYCLLASGYFESGAINTASQYLKKVNEKFIDRNASDELKEQYYYIKEKSRIIANYRTDEKIKNNISELRCLYNYFLKNNDQKSLSVVLVLINKISESHSESIEHQYQRAIANHDISQLRNIILKNNDYFFSNFMKHELNNNFIFPDIKKAILSIGSEVTESKSKHNIKNRINIIMSIISLTQNNYEEASIFIEKISRSDVYLNYYNRLKKIIKFNSSTSFLKFEKIPWVVIEPFNHNQRNKTSMSVNIDDVLDLEDDPKSASGLHYESITALSGTSKRKIRDHKIDPETMLDCVFGDSKAQQSVKKNDDDSEINKDSLEVDKSTGVFEEDFHEKESKSDSDDVLQSFMQKEKELESAQIAEAQSRHHKTITSCLRRVNFYCNNQVMQSQFMFSYRLGYKKRIIANLISNILEHSLDIQKSQEDTLSILNLFIESLVSSHSQIVSGEFEVTIRQIKKILDNPSNDNAYRSVDFSKLNLDQKIYTLLGDLYSSVADFFTKAYELSIFFYRKAIETLSEKHQELEDIPIINKVNRLVRSNQDSFDISYNAGLACGKKELFFNFFDKKNSSSKTKFEKLISLYHKYDNKNINVLKKMKEIYTSMSEELLLDSTTQNISFLDTVIGNLESDITSEKTQNHNHYTYTNDKDSLNLYKVLDILQSYKDTLANDGQWFFTYRAGYEKLKVCNTIYNILIDSKNTQDSISKRLKTIAYTIERLKLGEHNYLYSKRFKKTIDEIDKITSDYSNSSISEKYKNESLLKDIV